LVALLSIYEEFCHDLRRVTPEYFLERITRRARMQPMAIPTLEVTKSPQTKYFKTSVWTSTIIDEMRTSLDFDCNNI